MRFIPKILFVLCIASSFAACKLFLNSAASSNDHHLIAYFPFDENANDTINQKFKGKIFGATLVDGVKNNAYAFDGIDDYIEIDQSNQSFNFEYDAPYSISFWIKPARQQNDLTVHENDILSKWVANDKDTTHLTTGYPFCFRYLNQNSKRRQGKWYLANWGGYIDNCASGNKIVSESDLIPNQFQHIVFTQSKSELKLFLNGQLVSTGQNLSMCSTKNNAPLRIGKRGGLNYQNHFAGVIDELRIYGIALGEVEIGELFGM